MSNLKYSIEKAELEWQSEHGKCCMCDVGDRPVTGLHRGRHHCGNSDSCLLCHGCLPPGEICRACHRKNIHDVAC